VTEVHDEIAEILKRTPTELAYNKALERNIGFHKDLEFLITSITKRRNEALEVLDRYRQGLGKRAEQVVQEILDAEYKEVETAAVEHRGVENPPAKAGAADNQTRQLPPPLLPPAEADAKKAVTVSASVDEDDDDGSDE
jgi:phytoene dehydrogenase-like protein